MSDDQAIETKIQAKELNAPRLTPDQIEARIKSEVYCVFPGTSVTVCLLYLENGFSVTGESASVSVENFDVDIGREIARNNAKSKIWSLEGYLLKQRLHEESA